MTHDPERKPWHHVRVGETIYDPAIGAFIVDAIEDHPLFGMRVRLVNANNHDQAFHSKVDREYVVTVIA